MLNIKQRQLNLKMYRLCYSGKIDGIEGKGTKEAYKAFQAHTRIAVDGIYGTNTDNCLVNVIKDIQGKLGIAVDGIAGQETINAVKDFQRKNGLGVDGIVGAKTLEKLNTVATLTWDNIKHFKQSEFTCKCGCGLNNIDLRLVSVLDQIHEHFGQPCKITSGCRCVSHNRREGGVSNSKHIYGKASDIVVNNVKGKDLLAYTTQLVAEGKLNYTYLIVNNAVHIDIV